MTVISKVSSNFLTYLDFQFNRTGFHVPRTVNGAAAKNRHADLDVFLFSEKLIFETQRSQEPSRYFHSLFPLLKDAFC